MKIEKSEKTGSRRESSLGHLWLEPPVLCHWITTARQSSVCTVCCGSVAEYWWLKPEVSWVRLLVTAGFAPLYFCLITSRFNLTFNGNTFCHNSTLNDLLHLCQLCWAIWASASSLHITRTNNFIDNSISECHQCCWCNLWGSQHIIEF